MDGPIRRECVQMLLDRKFLRVVDLQYAAGKHYYSATRRTPDALPAVMDSESFRSMQPDAVTCIVILRTGGTARLLLSREYRYPAGRFLLSPPAGLLDPEDLACEEPLRSAARREIREETGLDIRDTDRLFTVSPLLFSSPGMTDESNGLVCAVLEDPDLSSLSQQGAVGSECFDGFVLADRETSLAFLKNGRDSSGIFYSAYTWAALMYFTSGLWEDHSCGAAEQGE